MQAEVAPLLVVNVNCPFTPQVLLLRFVRFAVFDGNLNLAVNHVVARTRGYPLGKFAMMVGLEIPGGMLLVRGMYRYANSVDRAVIWAKGRTKK